MDREFSSVPDKSCVLFSVENSIKIYNATGKPYRHMFVPVDKSTSFGNLASLVFGLPRNNTILWPRLDTKEKTETSMNKFLECAELFGDTAAVAAASSSASSPTSEFSSSSSSESSSSSSSESSSSSSSESSSSSSSESEQASGAKSKHMTFDLDDALGHLREEFVKQAFPIHRFKDWDDVKFVERDDKPELWAELNKRLQDFLDDGRKAMERRPKSRGPKSRGPASLKDIILQMLQEPSVLMHAAAKAVSKGQAHAVCDAKAVMDMTYPDTDKRKRARKV